jgi:hypothetical protein
MFGWHCVLKVAVATSQRRRQTDYLYPRTLGPREREALALIDRRPGITVAELAKAMGSLDDAGVAVRRTARTGTVAARPRLAGRSDVAPGATAVGCFAVRPRRLAIRDI